MTNRIPFNMNSASLLVGTAILAVLTAGCVTEQRSAYRVRPTVQVQAAVVFQDDYDYYPNYEIYYSRSRREYVYRDGNAWVRRPEPRGVTLDILLAAPSVRLDFHDAPEQHHNSVVKSYPRNWKRSGKDHAGKNERRDDEKNDRKDEDKRH